MQQSPFPSSWQGELHLAYAQKNDETQVVRAYAKAPFKVQRPFYPEGRDICHTVTLHTAGGVVGGDQLHQTVELHENSRALITTAAAAKVYRSNGQLARQTVKLQIEPGAYLEWLPQETILFNGAIYQQDIRVELAPGGSFCAWDIARLGRSARGETFLHGDWRSRLEVWQQGTPLWIDRQRLLASEELWFATNGLAEFPLVATLLYLGCPVSPETVEQARQLWEQTASPLNGLSGQAGVTQTQNQGLLCRYRGRSTAEVKNWFIEIWKVLRLSHLQRPARKLRVWP